MTKLQNTVVIDVCAITLSALCVVHCLAIPLLIVMLPVSTLWLENEWIHRVLVLLALPASGLAIYSSVSANERSWFPIFAAVGLMLLISAAFIEALHELETTLTVVGALLLAFAHVFRWLNEHRHSISD